MNHIAVDIGFRQSQVCIRGADSSILLEQRVDTRRLKRLFRKQPKSVVILETCSESEKIASWAREDGHDVRVVASTLSRQLGVGDHGVKTDQRDARNLSLASCRLDLPSVHLKSPVARERWSRLMARQSMVTARTQLINTVRGYLRMHLVPVRGTAENFPKRVKEALVKTPEGLPDYIENVLNSITALSDQIASAESSLKRVAVSDETCQRLMGIPGIGALTSLAFVAVVDDPTRFPNASSLYSYVGLAPGEHSSGAKKRRQGITKAGPPMLRQYLTQASLTYRRCRKTDSMTAWAESVAHRRGRHVATIATARKLVGIMWAMWRDGTDFNPTRTVQKMK